MQTLIAGYSIRPANANDLAVLPDIEREAAIRFAPYGLAEVMSSVVTSVDDFLAACLDGRLWVATDALGKPVGFAMASVVGANGHLDELDVLPEHGQRGLGSALVREVHQWAIRCGFQAVTLTTLDAIPWNRQFYEKLGYRVIDPGSLTLPLQTLLNAEHARGLSAQERKAMIYELSSVSGDPKSIEGARE